MEMNFAGKRAIVTGAGSGIGWDIAKTLSAAGATVYGVSILQTELDTLKTECPDIKTVCVDVSEWKPCQEAIRDIGPVDMLVNCAGVISLLPFLDETEDSYYRIFDVNVKGTLLVGQAVAKMMVEHKIKGSIVNISSIAAVRSSKISVYSASKAAVDQLSRCMAAELGLLGIRVNTVQPTLVPSTPMAQKLAAALRPEGCAAVAEHTALKRHAEVHHITSAVLYLLSDKAEMITGSALPVDAGYLCN